MSTLGNPTISFHIAYTNTIGTTIPKYPPNKRPTRLSGTNSNASTPPLTRIFLIQLLNPSASYSFSPASVLIAYRMNPSRPSFTK
ncbi:hypothetical protein D3C81_1948900 [compost metagenome]